VTLPTAIVVGTDESPAGKAALTAATELAAATGARVVAVHVRAVPASVEAGYMDASGVVEDAFTEIERELDDDVARVRQATGVEVELRHVHADTAAHGIDLVADEVGAGLIVVGSVGHSLIGTLLLGSVTNQLVRHSPHAVLVVRPPS